MKKISILLFYFVTFLSANGQLTNNKLGQYFDVEGENIQGYYDLDYQPEKPLEFVYNIVSISLLDIIILQMLKKL